MYSVCSFALSATEKALQTSSALHHDSVQIPHFSSGSGESLDPEKSIELVWAWI